MTNDRGSLYYVKGLPVTQTLANGEVPQFWEKTSIIGKSLPRVDGHERVSGAALYPSDLVLPDMQYGAILRCPHASARVKAVDLSGLMRVKGVRAFLGPSSADARLKWSYAQGYEDDLFPRHCRFEGEAVAAVAAETPYLAKEALKAIRVEYMLLHHVVDPARATAESAPEVHENGNLHEETKYSRGDIAMGFDAADVVIEQAYATACELHTPLELHGCVARWDGDLLTLWESTQGVYSVQQTVARILDMPLSKVRVIGHYLGEGFGSKLQTGKYSVIAVLLACRCGRPVKLFLTREEIFLSAGNRPASDMTLKAGVKKDGTLTALEFICLGSGGAFPSEGVSLVDWLVRDLYTCPNVKTHCRDVFINAGLTRPFRAPGHPQGSWALEQMMDALAKAINMDPVQLRLKNIPTVSQARKGPPPHTSTGLERCLKEGAEAFGWNKSPPQPAEKGNGTGHLRRGKGMAACSWIAGGGPPSTVIIKLFTDGSVNLNMGASDIGTGTKTIMALVAAEELGIKPEVIQIQHADTGTTQYATPSGGSKTVPTEAPTVQAAAVHVKRQLLQMAAEQLNVRVQELQYTGDAIQVAGAPDRKVGISALKTLQQRGVVVGVSYRGPNPDGKVVTPFGAQFCEVEVNTLTGEVCILRFVGAHDSGRVMNRPTFDSQVIGGITMGIGLAQTEFRVLDSNRTGKLVNKNWHDYKLPTALDVPAQIDSLPIEVKDPEANTVGAKGRGEPVTIPTAPAIANAVYNAIGVRCTETPINPLTLIRLLEEKNRSDQKKVPLFKGMLIEELQKLAAAD